MKNQTNHLQPQGYAETQARQAITHITKWVEERYPQISSSTKSKLIAQCLVELQREQLYKSSLN
jgi:N-acetyl-anhydromuramyl-L-alanine amidase AmpD